MKKFSRSNFLILSFLVFVSAGLLYAKSAKLPIDVFRQWLPEPGSQQTLKSKEPPPQPAMASDIGPGSYRVKQTIPLGPTVGNGLYPIELLINKNSNMLYCINETDNIAVIDLYTNELIKVIPTGKGLWHINMDTLMNRVYVTHSKGLSIIDGYNNEVKKTITTSGNATIVDQLTHRVYLAGSYLSVIDGISGEVIESIFIHENAGRAIELDKSLSHLYVIDNQHSLFIIDVDSLRLIQTIEVDTNPIDIAVDESTHRVYVVSANNYEFHGDLEYQGTITVIDGGSGNILNRIATGPIYGGNGSLRGIIEVDEELKHIYFVNYYNRSNLYILDGSSSKMIKSIEIGPGAINITIDKINHKVYVASYWSSFIDIIDGKTLESSKSKEIDLYPVTIAIDDRTQQVFTGNSFQNIITIDGKTGDLIKKTELGQAPFEMAIEDSSQLLYVLNSSSNFIDLVDLVSGELRGKIFFEPLDSKNHFSNPDIAIDKNNKRIFISDMDPGAILVLDGPTGQRIKYIPTHAGSSAMAFDQENHVLFVANQFSDNVSVIDGSTLQETTTLAVGERPSTIVLDKQTKRLFCATEPYSDNGKITVIDAASHNVVDSIEIGGRLWVEPIIKVNEVTHKVYVSSRLDNYIAIIDGIKSILSKKIDFQYTPMVITVDLLAGLIYVVTSNGRFTVIDAASDEILKEIMVGEQEEKSFILIDEKSNRIFVTNMRDNSISAIDRTTLEILATVQTENDPIFITYNQPRGEYVVLNRGSASISVIEDTQNKGVSPMAPSSIKVVEANNSLQLTWPHASNQYTQEKFTYRLYRGLSRVGPFIKIAEGLADTTYFDQGLVNGTTYYYRASSFIPSLNIEGYPSITVSGTPRGQGDFTLAVTPASLRVSIGGQVQARVGVNSVEDFAGGVSLSFKGSPTGLTATFDRTSITPDSVALLNIRAYAGIAPGAYKLSISGVSGVLERKAELRVGVINPFVSATLELDRDSVSVGEVLVLSGTAGGGASSVQLSVSSQRIDTLLAGTLNSGGEFRVEYMPQEVGVYRVRFEGYGGVERSFEVLRAHTRISLSTNVGNDYVLGNSALVLGKIHPAPAGSRMHLELTSPGGDRREELMDVNEEGFFIREFNFGEKGKWYLKAWWTGNPNYAAAESGYLQVPVGLSTGKAVVVEGFGEANSGCDCKVVENLGSYAYRILSGRRYGDGDIYYLSNRSEKDIDGDGLAEVDGTASISGLRAVLEGIVKRREVGEESPLFMYLIGGGYRTGEYRLSENESISYTEIGEMLKGLEIGTGVRDIIVLADKPKLDGFLTQVCGVGRTLISGEPGWRRILCAGRIVVFQQVHAIQDIHG